MVGHPSALYIYCPDVAFDFILIIYIFYDFCISENLQMHTVSAGLVCYPQVLQTYTHWATSLFGLVFRSVQRLSPKTNLMPEFWSQSDV